MCNIVLGTNDSYSFGFFQNVTIWTNKTKPNVLWMNVSHFYDQSYAIQEYNQLDKKEFINNLELALECDASFGIYTSN
jgi:uncharacterized Fe-S radical SAM superfamily protein PflX